MNPVVKKAITDMGGDPLKVLENKALPNFGERLATRFKDFGADFVQTGKNFAKIADRLDGSKPVFLVINGVTYILSNCHVEESYEVSSDYQESNHPDSPPILVPNAHSLTLKITLPLGREQDYAKFMIIKNAIRLQTLLVGTSGGEKSDIGFLAEEKINIYDSFRFGVFTGATPGPLPSNRKRLTFDEKRYKKAVKFCAKDQKIKWKEVTADQKMTIQSCVNEQEAEYIKEQQEIADYIKARGKASCAEEELYKYEEGNEEAKKQSDIKRIMNDFHRKALRRSTRAEFRKQPKHVRKGVSKHEGFPWQIQIACAYFGRNEFLLFATLVKFSSQNIPGETAETWEIILLGFNFRHDPRKKLYTKVKVEGGVVHDASQENKNVRDCSTAQKNPLPESVVNEKISAPIIPPKAPPLNPREADKKSNQIARRISQNLNQQDVGASAPNLSETFDSQQVIRDACEKEKNSKTILRAVHLWQKEKYDKNITVCEDSDIAQFAEKVKDGTVSGAKVVFNFLKKPFTTDLSAS